jgi:S1-C subfamily serine protease
LYPSSHEQGAPDLERLVRETVLVDRIVKWKVVVIFMGCSLLPCAALSAESVLYEITFQNGRTVQTREHYEEGGTTYYLRYGNYIGVESSFVRSIVAVAREETDKEDSQAYRFKRRLIDLRKQLLEAYPPKNHIERARNCTVKIETVSGHGSGFFISAEGHLLTNKHVVKGDTQRMEKGREKLEEEQVKLERLRQRLQEEEARLREQEMILEEARALIDVQRKSKVKAHNLKQYQHDLERFAKWKSAFQERRRAFERWQEALDERRYEMENMEYRTEAQRDFKVLLLNQSEVDAHVVAISDRYDAALLKLDDDRVQYQTPFLTSTDVSQMAHGERLYAIGNPMDLNSSITSGVLSAYDRKEQLIQTNAQINPGNSGGPLVTEQGHVVGISTKKTVGEAIEGLGFAIEINTALREFSEFLSSEPDG